MLESVSFDFAGQKTSFFPWLLRQPVGWLVTLAGIVARVRHDVVSRTLGEKIKISQTNEMQVPNIFKQREDGKWIVDGSKITMQLVKFRAIMDWMAALMGPVVWGLFQTKGFGWMDFPRPNEKKAFNMLECGGNLVEVMEIFGVHALLATQDIRMQPDMSLTYENAPHLFVKQVVVGHNRNKETYYICDQNRGDIVMPFTTNVQATLPISSLEWLPQEFPFETMLWGRVPVTIERVVFQGSDTWANIGGGRWVCIEKMEVTGLGSWKDRRLYISPEHWFGTCPPPVKGWTKGKVISEQ